MERLTSKRAWENASQDLASEMGYSHIWKRLAAIEDILGDEYDLSRLHELVEADRDGRCVVLPCKPSGVTVYQLRGKRHALGRGVHKRNVGCAMVWSDKCWSLEHQGEEPCRAKDFGKTWFLSEEQAEKALREQDEKKERTQTN